MGKHLHMKCNHHPIGRGIVSDFGILIIHECTPVQAFVPGIKWRGNPI